MAARRPYPNGGRRHGDVSEPTIKGFYGSRRSGHGTLCVELRTRLRSGKRPRTLLPRTLLQSEKAHRKRTSEGDAYKRPGEDVAWVMVGHRDPGPRHHEQQRGRRDGGSRPNEHDGDKHA